MKAHLKADPTLALRAARRLLALAVPSALASAQFALDDGSGHAKPMGGTYTVT